jgi:hypothetical protein
MPGASGVLNKVSYKRPIKRMADGDVHARPPATEAAAALAAPATAVDPRPQRPPLLIPLAEAVVSPVKDKPAKGGRGTKSR